MAKETSEVQEIKDEIARHASIEAVGEMEGGKMIIEATQQEVDFSIDRLANGFEMATNDELRSWCATLKANLTLLNLLKGAREKKEIAMQDLKQIKSQKPPKEYEDIS